MHILAPLSIQPLLFSLCLCFFTHSSIAQITLSTGGTLTTQTSKKKTPTVRELNWVNQQRLESQRIIADKLIRKHLGRQLRQTRLDLPLIQRLTKESFVTAKENEELQALGIAMGDIFITEHKDLNWRVYTDELGPSHAVCFKETTHCLFPITMISKRLKVGLEPDIEKVYLNALANIKEHIPRLPYSREK